MLLQTFILLALLQLPWSSWALGMRARDSNDDFVQSMCILPNTPCNATYSNLMQCNVSVEYNQDDPTTDFAGQQKCLCGTGYFQNLLG